MVVFRGVFTRFLEGQAFKGQVSKRQASVDQRRESNSATIPSTKPNHRQRLVSLSTGRSGLFSSLLWFLSLMGLCLSLGIGQARGDETEDVAEQKWLRGRQRKEERLPKSEPLPGEEMQTAEGERIKVWSTQGSPTGGVVPEAPAPPESDSKTAGSSVTVPGGVIVDMRER